MHGDSPGTVVRAGLIAAVVSGVPSTVHALLTGRDPLEATAAAGSLVLGSDRSKGELLLAAVPTHLVLSIGWTFLIAALLPQRRRVLAGTAYGAGIALFDLGVVGRAVPRIRALPFGPQLADHLVFGAVVAALTHCRRRAA